MATNVGRVSVSLNANTAEYVNQIREATSATDREARKMQRAVNMLGNKTNSKFGSMGGGIGKLTKGLGGLGRFVPVIGQVATAIGTIGAAIASTTIKTAQQTRELQNMANMAKLTIDEFNSLDVAAKSVGGTGEQLADITKDITDKAQEFARDGTGGFADFATELGLSEEAAKQMAAQMVEMSGPQAMQFMIDQMESAGLSTNQMTQALESMGNDLSKYVPLFANGGEKMSEFDERMKDVAGTSQENIDNMLKLASSVDIMGSAIADAARDGVAPAVEWVDSLVNSATEFIALWNDNSDIAKKAKLEDLSDDIKQLEKDIEDCNTWYGRFGNSIIGTATDVGVLQKELDKARDAHKELKTELEGDIEMPKFSEMYSGTAGEGTVLLPEGKTSEPKKKEEPKKVEQTEAELAAIEAAQEKHNRLMNELYLAAQSTELDILKESQRQALEAFDQKYAGELAKTEEYAQARKNLIAEQEAAIAELENQSRQEAIKIEMELKTQQTDLEIQGAETDLQRMQMQNAAELAAFQAKYDEKTKMTEQYLATEKALKEAHANAEKQLEEQATLDIFGIQRDAEGQIIATSGSAATAQLAISQAQALGKAWELGPVAGITASAAMVGTFSKLFSQVNGAVNSFAVGSDSLSEDQFAFVHEGERIVPKKSNQDLGMAMDEINNIHKMLESNRMQPLAMPPVSENNTSSIVVNAPFNVSGGMSDKDFQEYAIKHRQIITAAVKKTEKERPNQRRR